ncbi:M20/M25/M40 family metallo-hydrolase [Fulvivirga sedimenti]|uniref:Carboxypeptidase Q n=1 Tax=Fulvivirga sedimenti TaxID=2879465 RepID=A0A9X1L2P4_9BACT|nr:M20/M25/M40 family metallo-hydrolase [Fulvivirga sedimenti]MCA6078406.1 M20/M25/M40 family metallo-hydrolase [Fulvivirga sedimenti]
MKPVITFCVLFFGLTFFLAGQEKIDYDAIAKMKSEGMENSQIEMIASYLTDVSGPRLTNSPGLMRASEWAVEEMKKWGLKNVALEPWGEFGKGWQVDKSYVAMTEPYYMPFIAVPKAWTGSTSGLVSGEVMLVDIQTEEDLEKYRGKLNGKIVLVADDYDVTATFEADGNRYTDEELKEMEKYPSQNGGSGDYSARYARYRAMREFRNKVNDFMASENAALIISARRGRHGTFFTSNGASYAPGSEVATAEFEMAPEYTNMMKRLLAKGIPVKLEAEIRTSFYEDDIKGYNVIGEIPGTDKNLKDEVVMIGGHLDSWHAGTGATDNASGCAVMLEALRIIKTLGLQPKRTIRVALWTGEEQGIHGSRNYVKNHFGDSETMALKPEHEKLSAYYNIDNGTGRIRGVYLQGNEGARPVFASWFSAMSDIIETPTITIRNTGGTDHLGFDAVGLPGFQFIQDEVEYNTRTHHTNMDVYDRLEIDDLKQMATVIAIITYHTAQRPEKMPRESIPVVTGSN